MSESLVARLEAVEHHDRVLGGPHRDNQSAALGHNLFGRAWARDMYTLRLHLRSDDRKWRVETQKTQGGS